MTWQKRNFLLPGYLLLCLLIGGGSSANWGNAALQLLALPLIFWALAAKGIPETPPAARYLFSLVCALVVLIVLQVIPLPPELWTKLPGRESVARSYDLMGLAKPWLPVSLASDRTIASAMWLLPWIAILLVVLKFQAERPALHGWVMVGVVLAATMLGVPQIGSGQGYIYEIPNLGALTGFFSNTNHMATLIVATLPFVAAIYSGRRSRRRSSKTSTAWALVAVVITFSLMGIYMTGSLAAFAIVVPVVGCSLMIMMRGKQSISKRWRWLIAALGLVAVALVLSPSSGSDLTGDRATTHELSRYRAWQRSLLAIRDHAPVGSGLGTFGNVYPRYEDPARVEMTYMNHAHNEYLEIALEMGVPGFALIAAFLFWWTRQTLSIWRNPEHSDVFAQAATITTAAIMVHSIIDYPLRMTAISAVFALCCGLMATRPRGFSVK
jgi:O-antigen ligase